METIIKQASRGHTKIDWLDSKHSFSFGNYHDPSRMGFGALRVLNDDKISPASGFPMHPHKNMEIITIVLTGALTHKDNLGHTSTLSPNDVQVMTAGSGIVHSEFNASKTNSGEFLQIWILPKENNALPKYSQRAFDMDTDNRIITVASGFADDKALPIHQDALLAIVKVTKEVTYTLQKKTNGVYAFIIEGSVSINGHQLNSRDAIEISHESQIKITGKGRVLVIDIPL